MPHNAGTLHSDHRMLRDLYDLLDALDRRLIVLRRTGDAPTIAEIEALRNRTADQIQRLENDPGGPLPDAPLWGL